MNEPALVPFICLSYFLSFISIFPSFLWSYFIFFNQQQQNRNKIVNPPKKYYQHRMQTRNYYKKINEQVV